MTNEQIKYLVDRFLVWKLPEHFVPDAGISFKATYNEHTAYPAKHEPSGTNLFDGQQATAMVRYMVEGMPSHVHLDRYHLADVLLCYGEFGASEANSGRNALKCADAVLEHILKPQGPKSLPQKLRDFVMDARLAQGDAMERLGKLHAILCDLGLKIIEE